MNDIWRDLFHLRADATLAIGLLLAVGVTVHILLTKREVASAVGGSVWSGSRRSWGRSAI